MGTMSLMQVFHSYWTEEQIMTNFIIFLNLLGALALGMALGFERTIHGRAAGLRTYGLVAAASCAITILSGYPHQWFGGSIPNTFFPDPTRVIQGIVTGVGFLGAGVIMKDGLSISGLSTAASIWMCSAIGILVGVGLYGAAIILTILSFGVMMISKLETLLPQRNHYSVQLVFKEGHVPHEQNLRTKTNEKGFEISDSGINVSFQNNQIIWKYNAFSTTTHNQGTLTDIGNALALHDGIASFDITKIKM